MLVVVLVVVLVPESLEELSVEPVELPVLELVSELSVELLLSLLSLPVVLDEESVELSLVSELLVVDPELVVPEPELLELVLPELSLVVLLPVELVSEVSSVVVPVVEVSDVVLSSLVGALPSFLSVGLVELSVSVAVCVVVVCVRPGVVPMPWPAVAKLTTRAVTSTDASAITTHTMAIFLRV